MVGWTAVQQLLWSWEMSHCSWKAGAAAEHSSPGTSSLTAQLRGLSSYVSREWESPGLVWITSETSRCCSKSPWPGNQAGKLPRAVWCFSSLASFPKLPRFWLGWQSHKNGPPRVFQKFPFQSHLRLGCGGAGRKDKIWAPAWSHRSLDVLPVFPGWRLSPCKEQPQQQTLLEPSSQAFMCSHTFIIFPSLRFLRPLQPNWVVLKRPSCLIWGFRHKDSDFPSLLPSVKVPLQPTDAGAHCTRGENLQRRPEELWAPFPPRPSQDSVMHQDPTAVPGFLQDQPAGAAGWVKHFPARRVYKNFQNISPLKSACVPYSRFFLFQNFDSKASHHGTQISQRTFVHMIKCRALSLFYMFNFYYFRQWRSLSAPHWCWQSVICSRLFTFLFECQERHSSPQLKNTPCVPLSQCLQ